jgi:diacylglycerol kinase (ATP)
LDVSFSIYFSTVKRKILFLINPVSGISNKERIKELIHQKIDKTRFIHHVLFTGHAGHGMELSKEAISKGVDAVIVVGGDGSVNEVASALVNSSVSLGIIPTGSGNGLAHYLRLPFNLSRSLDTINKLKTLKIDTLTMNNHLCVNLAGVGFDAKVANEFSKVKRRGFWSYFQIVINEYPRYEVQEYQLNYDGKSITRKALLICFANSNQFGNGVVIAPEAKIDDGLIDVCIVSRVPLIEAPIMGQMMILKLIDRTHYVEYIRTSEITLIQEGNYVAHIDGDPVFPGKEINVKVNPLSLNVIVN